MHFVARRFVVTGAGSGIGRAVAARLATAGASISLVGRDLRKLEAAAAELAPGSHDVWSVDLRDGAQIAAFADRFLGRHAEIQGLVHSAGDFRRSRVAEGDTAATAHLMAVNALAPFQLSAALLPLLRASRGDIVFVNSSAARGGDASIAAYAMSKSALRALADALRAEENAAGVRVLSVFPGRTATPMLDAVVGSEGGGVRAERLLQPGDVAEVVVAALGLPATAEVTELHIRPRLPPIDR